MKLEKDSISINLTRIDLDYLVASLLRDSNSNFSMARRRLATLTTLISSMSQLARDSGKKLSTSITLNIEESSSGTNA